jgi:hypothetical protein
LHPTRIFKSPDDLLKAWNAYKEDLKEKSNEWKKIQYVGKYGEKKEDAQKLPLIMDGFESFCYDNYGCVEQYFKNQDKLYTDFIPICSRIRKEIRTDQITGGMLNMYNPSITQRLNGLKDISESTVNQSVSILNIDPLADEE